MTKDVFQNENNFIVMFKDCIEQSYLDHQPIANGHVERK